ncbi:DUF1841 family protein [Polynucleobacter sp. MWH-Mekk-B1]|nr:DUF1841 family protein [Polynucleobacter finlandensis]
MADIPARHATLIVRNALWNPYAASNKKQVKEKFVAIFNPTREDVRRFFCDTWKKKTESHILTLLETIAGDWMEQHPEYHTLLTDSDGALAQDYTPERGETNPFLHLSMHLSISEQISIDQPPGIRKIAENLAGKLGSEHEAQHRIMECLGQVMWESQRDGVPLSPEKYIEALQKLN